MKPKQPRKQRGKEVHKVVLPLAESRSKMPEKYISFFELLEKHIAKERLKTILRANADMVMLYWHIGRTLNELFASEDWGTEIIDRMAHDLREAFPEMEGFSQRQLKRTQRFAEAWPDEKLVKRILSRIPWNTNLHLLEKLEDAETRLWYAQKALEHGLGKNMIVFWIEWKMHLREDKPLKKRVRRLPPLDSDMAEHSAKDAYIFDYFGNAKHIREKELKNHLSEHIRNYLMQSGQGFALVGEKVHIELGGSDYYIDQLYYHTRKKCYVVVELQTEKFDPGHTSGLHLKMNVVSESLKQEDDNATIGMLLVKSKSQTLVEYSIKGSKNDISVASWRDDMEEPLLPDELLYYLPTIEEMERELAEF